MYPVDEDIQREMKASTERAAAIVGHAHIEEECANALRRLLQGDKDLLRDTMRAGFLQSHAARVDLLYFVGAITKDVRDDLRELGRIRNAFAHNSNVRGFDNPKVAGPLTRMRLLNVTHVALQFLGEPEPTKRELFEFCVGNAVAILRRRHAPLVGPPLTESDGPAP